MDKLDKKKFQNVFELMQMLGINKQEYDAYYNEKTNEKVIARKKKAAAKKRKFAFEVLYVDGEKSWFYRAGVEPLAIIVGTTKIAMEEAPNTLTWPEAKTYCDTFSAGGKKWSLPAQTDVEVMLQNEVEIDKILSVFGKKLLENYGYWTCYAEKGKASYFYHGIKTVRKDADFFARPVML